MFFLFTLMAGASLYIVLSAALASAAEERRYELAVMRGLGARREQLRRALLAEFASIAGLVAGLIAALGATAVGQMLAHKAFQLVVAINYGLPLAAMFGGALLVAAVGWFAAAQLMDTPPLEALRAG